MWPLKSTQSHLQMTVDASYGSATSGSSPMVSLVDLEKATDEWEGDEKIGVIIPLQSISADTT